MRGSSFWWAGPLCPAHTTGCCSGPRIPCRLGCVCARGPRHVNSAPAGAWAVSGGSTSANSFHPHSLHSRAASLSFLHMKVMRPEAGGGTALIPFAQFTRRLQRSMCKWKRLVRENRICPSVLPCGSGGATVYCHTQFPI